MCECGVKWVRRLAAIRPPNLKVSADNFMSAAMGRLPFFLTLETAAASASTTAPAILSGKQAVAAIMQQLKGKFASNQAVSLKDLQLLDAYSFVLTGEQKTTHQEWVKRIFANAGSEGAVTAPIKSVPRAEPAAKKRAATAASASKKVAPSSTVVIFKKRKTT